MAPVLKTGIVKKNYRGFESLSLLLFFNNHIYWSGPIKKKKRIARLYIAELQGSSWKESILKYSYPADMGDRCNEIESIYLPSGSIYFFS